MGAETGLEDLGIFGRQLLRARTVYGVIATARRMAPSFNSGETCWLREGSVEGLYCHRYTVQLADWAEQAEQSALSTGLAFLRSVIGPAWRPTVHLKTGMPRAIRELPLLRDTELVFDQPVCAVAIPRRYLHQAITVLAGTADTSVRAVADWRSTSPGVDLVTSLRQWMTQIVRTDAVRIDVVAEGVGTTARTLQRRLAASGTSFGCVLGEARFEMAARLLGHDDVAIRDVAREIGYPDAAHLTRAFRRWTGTTPSEFRRIGREPHPGSGVAIGVP